MAGHSKWSNIKHRKGRQDAKKGKIFTKISKEIFQAVREGGDNTETNNNLRLALDKARQNNMPNENIDRTIKKATGNLEGVTYVEKTYEGYAPYGTAVFVEALTDNKNRAAAEVRLAFNKNGGNLGEDGCVSFMFDRRGHVTAEIPEERDEDEMMLTLIDAGAEDVQFFEDGLEVLCSVPDFQQVHEAVKQLEGVSVYSAELAMIPQTKTPVSEAQYEEVMQLIEALEDCDDVQSVAHNAAVE
ncbi:YebC/PmpR family DNA-binding transcriptional regulator [Alkalicoccus urumqiensis]|uniref:Probable transcriptional regulatory protein C6I21_11150 n=1 Tax=Alkalicoccus urumqiensis TaxID=1548213 RepID=A0A2P6MFV2_ALKUR|nr:YebC/PmpR family DNA-binding transcriptional regulator [Alkalicoccus urumqiensis]PRO65147.1 YebC/PmpR family DNA-binding transcriptional regulator [Alkalicoccus urumqiensis]